MSKNKQEVSQVDRVEEEDTINLLDLLLVFARHKKKILIIPLLIGCVVAVYSLQVPVVYSASTTLVPAPTGYPGEKLISFLKSRSLQDQVLSKHKLQTARAVNFSTGRKDGIITITVDDGDPEKAAQMANAYVDELRELRQKIMTQHREFFEKQLDDAKAQIQEAEKEFGNFKEVAEPPVSGTEFRIVSTNLVGYVIARNLNRETLLEYTRRFRALNIAETQHQYVLAGQPWGRGVPEMFQVLDVAVPPGKRSSSVNTKWALMAVVASGFLMILLVFILEAKRQAEQDPEQAEKIAELSKSLRKL